MPDIPEPATELADKPSSATSAKLVVEPQADMSSELIIEPQTDIVSELIIEPQTELTIESKTASVSNKKAPSDLRRKLNALTLIVGHDILLIGAISYFAGGISWLWDTFNIVDAGVLCIQVSIAVWLMLPATSWRIRPVALYLAIGVIYVGVLFVVLYILAIPFVPSLQNFPVRFQGGY